MGLNAISTTYLFDTFTDTLCVGYDNVAPGFNLSGDSLDTCSALAISPITDLPGRFVKSFLLLVQSPFRIFAFSESLPEVVLFLLQQLMFTAHCFGPMGGVWMIIRDLLLFRVLMGWCECTLFYHHLPLYL